MGRSEALRILVLAGALQLTWGCPAPVSPADAGSQSSACAVNNGGCDPHATCLAGNKVGCLCLSGFVGDGFSCSPADCSSGAVTCDPNATCLSISGANICTCNAGFAGNGMVCMTASGPGPDAGSSSDAGLPPDAGPALDAGPAADAGSGVDAGPGAADAGPPTDAGAVEDAGTSDSGPPGTLQSQTVSGQIQIDPLELQWRGLLSTWTPPVACQNGQAADGTAYRADAGLYPFTPPCLAGDSVAIVDQIREAHDAGPLGSGETMWPGTYAVPDIDLVNTSLGLLGAVTDPSGLSAPSVGIVALPPFVPSGTSSTPIFVLTTAFMEHVASVIGMPFATMMSQGVALIHVVESDGVTPANNQQLFWLHGIPVGTLQPGFYPSASLTELPFSATMTSAPYVYYLSSDLNGVIFDNNGAVSTSSSGLVVVVGPPPLLSTASGSQYEMAYTSEESGEGTFVVFGVQPNAVVDVLLPDQ